MLFKRNKVWIHVEPAAVTPPPPEAADCWGHEAGWRTPESNSRTRRSSSRCSTGTPRTTDSWSMIDETQVVINVCCYATAHSGICFGVFHFSTRNMTRIFFLPLQAVCSRATQKKCKKSTRRLLTLSGSVYYGQRSACEKPVSQVILKWREERERKRVTPGFIFPQRKWDQSTSSETWCSSMYRSTGIRYSLTGNDVCWTDGAAMSQQLSASPQRRQGR